MELAPFEQMDDPWWSTRTKCSVDVGEVGGEEEGLEDVSGSLTVRA